MLTGLSLPMTPISPEVLHSSARGRYQGQQLYEQLDSTLSYLIRVGKSYLAVVNNGRGCLIR